MSNRFRSGMYPFQENVNSGVFFNEKRHPHPSFTRRRNSVASKSVNSAISKGVTVIGLYTVNRDCSGSLARSDGTNYDFVVAPDGSPVFWIETDYRRGHKRDRSPVQAFEWAHGIGMR
jgi:hypothetical protein